MPSLKNTDLEFFPFLYLQQILLSRFLSFLWEKLEVAGPAISSSFAITPLVYVKPQWWLLSLCPVLERMKARKADLKIRGEIKHIMKCVPWWKSCNILTCIRHWDVRMYLALWHLWTDVIFESLWLPVSTATIEWHR